MAEPIRIAICDADPLARGGLAGFVATWTDCDLVSTGRDAEYGHRVIAEPGVDVVLLDARTVRVARTLGTRLRARVVYLTTQEDAVLAADLAAGIADGLISKDSDPALLAAAVRSVHRGLSVASGGQLRILRPPRGAGPRETLPQRQAHVLELVCRGWSNARIASAMHLSVSSVKGVVSDLLRLMGVSNRVTLALRAMEEGMFTP